MPGNISVSNEFNICPILEEICYNFFDDILVYSSSLQDHLTHLKTVFETMRKNKLLVKLSKCSFGQGSMGFLGHIIESDGIHPDP